MYRVYRLVQRLSRSLRLSGVKIGTRPIARWSKTLRRPSFSSSFCARALLVAVALLIGGCSRFGLVYNRLDLLADLQLRSFVDLDDRQNVAWRAAFARTWHWHRSTQLPRYAAHLREIAAGVDRPLDATGLAAIEERVRLDGLRLGAELVRESAPLVASLSDAQVTDFLEEMDERAARTRRKQLTLSDADWVEQRYDEGLDRWEDWAGAATAAQEARLQMWAQSLLPLRSGSPDRTYEAFRRDLATLLTERGHADFALRLEKLILSEPPDAPRRTAWRAARQALLLDLHRDATPAQRTHLRKRLLAMAAEMEELARKPG